MWARITEQDGVEVVAEVIIFDPATRFTPDIAAMFVPATEGMVYMARKIDGEWVAPPSPSPAPEPVEPEPPAPTFRTSLTRTEYYGMFTAVEEAMIRLTADTPVTVAEVEAATGAEKQRLVGLAALKVMLRRIDALGPSDRVDVANPQVQQGLALLVSLGLMTQERVDAIEQGVPL